MKSKLPLGAFSISLSVQDIQASLDFYSKIGFEKIGGDIEQNWLILRNGDAKIGLFQGMFERNCLTFNPGWTADQETPEDFVDVREVQKRFEDAGLQLITRADPESTGPASFTLVDPDGNPVLVDQHV